VNLYKIAADITVLIHFSWIVFLIFGAIIGRYINWVKILHISGLGFALLIQIAGWYCPLTYIEIWFRNRGDPSGTYKASFIINYVEKIVYIELPGKFIMLATVIILIISATIYLYKPGEKNI
jgi:hypothetical protein